MHPAGGGQVGVDLALEQADPAQRQQEVVWLTQREVGNDDQLLQVQVGGEGAVEQDEAPHTGLGQTPGEVRERGPERPQLQGHRDVDGVEHIADRRQQGGLDLGRGEDGVGGHDVHVQLERVGAGVGQAGARSAPSRRC